MIYRNYSANLMMTLLLFFVASVFLDARVSYSADGTYLEMGLADFKNESYEEAIPALLKAFDAEPSSASTALHIGLAYKETLDYRQSKVYLNKALSLDPSIEKTYGHLGEVLYATNATSELEALILKARGKGVSSSRISYLEGLVHLSKGHKIRGENTLNSLIASDPGSEAAILAEKTKGSIKKGKGRLKLGVAYSYQYDDNVMLKPSQDISSVSISDESDERSVFTVKGDYTTSVGSFGLNTYYSFYKSIHNHHDELDLDAHKLSLTPSKQLGPGIVHLMTAYEHYAVDSDSYLEILSFKPSYTHPLDSNRWLKVTAGISSRDFLYTPVNQNEDRDGIVLNVGLGYIVAYGNNGAYIQLGYDFDKNNADGNNWKNRENKGSVALLHPFTDRLNLNCSISYSDNNYANSHSTYGIERKDKISAIISSLSYKYKKLNLKLEASYTDSDSNIGTYDYDRRIVGAGVEAVF